MDYGLVYEHKGTTVITGVQSFELDDTLDCGQCFRWEKISADTYEGIARGRYLKITKQGDTVFLHDTPLVHFEQIWKSYFDLDRDYGAVKKLFSGDRALEKAVAFAPGIRVLRQDPWEALCSFILSQNNNIPRIKGLVRRLCESFGEPHRNFYAFPKPQVLAGLTEEDMAPVRAGFRTKYILDCAQKIASGEIDLDSLYDAPIDEARAALQTIRGVGPKVADCALLYGFGRVESVPEDVWIKRALVALYPNGFPDAYAQVAGLAQQYLFHYVRSCDGALEV